MKNEITSRLLEFETYLLKEIEKHENRLKTKTDSLVNDTSRWYTRGQIASLTKALDRYRTSLEADARSGKSDE